MTGGNLKTSVVGSRSRDIKDDSRSTTSSKRAVRAYTPSTPIGRNNTAAIDSSGSLGSTRVCLVAFVNSILMLVALQGARSSDQDAGAPPAALVPQRWGN